MGELVSNGFSILIFPEGQISHSDEILPFQPGVGLLASRLNLPVVPVRLKGLGEVLHPTWHYGASGSRHRRVRTAAESERPGLREPGEAGSRRTDRARVELSQGESCDPAF